MMPTPEETSPPTIGDDQLVTEGYYQNNLKDEEIDCGCRCRRKHDRTSNSTTKQQLMISPCQASVLVTNISHEN